MNLRAAALALIIFLLLAAPGLAVTTKTKILDGTMTLTAGQIDISSDKLVATGKAHIHWVDTVKKTTMTADAEKIVVTMMHEPTVPKAPAKGAKPSKWANTTIKSAVLTGPVKLIYVMTDADGKSTITASADNADFDGKANLAHLVGNVRIVNDNPALFSAPASMSGDKATVNLKPSGPDDFRFRVETASPGVSTITATPKAKPEADKNK